MGATDFKMKTLKHVGTEIALRVLAYNIKRVIEILSVPELEPSCCGHMGDLKSWAARREAPRGSMTRKSELEAAKEIRRADRLANQAKRYATDPEYQARMQAHARKRYAEKRADPKWYAEHKAERGECYRTQGKFLPNRQLTRQRAYAKLAANSEWRERHNTKQRDRYRNDLAFRARRREGQKS
jgi:hypothetical protein